LEVGKMTKRKRKSIVPPVQPRPQPDPYASSELWLPPGFPADFPPEFPPPPPDLPPPREPGPFDGEVRWAKLRREQVTDGALRDAVLIQPIGAIEQHGPHLPIDTDAATVTEVAERAAREVGDGTALVLPTIAWGLSPYWMPYAGTITLRPETILSLLVDIGSSVAGHGFGRMVILNGHGGNAGIIGVAATQVAVYGVRAVALSYWSLLGAELGELAPADQGLIGHAGQAETSLQLRLQPERVDPAYAKLDEWTDLTEMARSPLMTAAYAPPQPHIEAPNGIYGNPTRADAAIGEAIIQTAAERLADLIRDLPPSPSLDDLLAELGGYAPPFA
jgi:creatinine amidohydrolase